MIRSFGLALGVFVVTLLLGAVILFLSTREVGGTLSQREIDRAQQADAAAAGAALGDGLSASGTGEASGLDSAFDAGAPAAAGSGSAARLETLREEAQKALIGWHALAMAAGLIGAWTWLAQAVQRSKTVHGVQGQRSAGGGWWGGLLLFGVLAAAAAWFMLRGEGLAALIATSKVILGLCLTFGLGLVGFYLATACGAPLVMRPSVPLATTLIPMRRT